MIRIKKKEVIIKYNLYRKKSKVANELGSTTERIRQLVKKYIDSFNIIDKDFKITQKIMRNDCEQEVCFGIEKVNKLFHIEYSDMLYELLKLKFEDRFYIDNSNEDNNVIFVDKNDKLEYENNKDDVNNKVVREVNVYYRNITLKNNVLKKSNGKCKLCKKDAPFENKDGKPFLEIHHILPLCEGGVDDESNMAALCPNCHRKIHILQNEEDIKVISQSE